MTNKERLAKYYQDNKERVKARSAAWAKNNPEKRRAIRHKWRSENHALALEVERTSRNKRRKDIAEFQRKYRGENPGVSASYCAKRRASKLQATPKWLTEEHLQDIEQTYVEAKELQWLSIEPLQVDHIVPLQGKNVSGLHVPWNLQILPRPINCRKNNKHE